MATLITTISIEDGKTATVNFDDLGESLQQALKVLGEAEANASEFKDIVEDAAEATGLKKSQVSKFFKERFAAKTKSTKALGALFTMLDEGLDN